MPEAPAGRAVRAFPAARTRPRPAPRRRRGEQEDRLPAEGGVEQAADQRTERRHHHHHRSTQPIIEAARLRSNRSRMMARPTTMPAEAPNACRMRADDQAADRVPAIAARLAAAVSARPASITGRRPKRSDSGPSRAARPPAQQKERDRELHGGGVGGELRAGPAAPAPGC